MADERIRTALGAYIEDVPFVFSVRAEKFGPKNGLIVFPAINGSTLIASKSLNKLPETCAKIGAALGKVHIGCLLSKGLLEDFYRNDCDLTNHEILMHEDFQASNVILTNDGKVLFVDTDGVELSKNEPYRNIQELWELMGDQALMQAALSGYLSNYEPSKQQAVLDHIRLHMKIKISETAYPTKLPVQPLSVQQLVNNKENVQP